MLVATTALCQTRLAQITGEWIFGCLVNSKRTGFITHSPVLILDKFAMLKPLLLKVCGVRMTGRNVV